MLRVVRLEPDRVLDLLERDDVRVQRGDRGDDLRLLLGQLRRVRRAAGVAAEVDEVVEHVEAGDFEVAADRRGRGGARVGRLERACAAAAGGRRGRPGWSAAAATRRSRTTARSARTPPPGHRPAAGRPGRRTAAAGRPWRGWWSSRRRAGSAAACCRPPPPAPRGVPGRCRSVGIRAASSPAARTTSPNRLVLKTSETVYAPTGATSIDSTDSRAAVVERQAQRDRRRAGRAVLAHLHVGAARRW